MGLSCLWVTHSVVTHDVCDALHWLLNPLPLFSPRNLQRVCSVLLSKGPLRLSELVAVASVAEDGLKLESQDVSLQW